MLKNNIALGVLAVLLGSAGARAGIATANFDFENQAVNGTSHLTSLSLVNNGLTLTIDRVGQPFDIVNLSSYAGAAAYGSRTLSPTPPGGNFFNLNFSSPVSNFSAQLGDFGVGFSDSLALTAFTGANGTGTNLGSSFATLPLTSNSTLAFKTLSITGTGIKSVELTGGTTSQPNSVFYDNFNAKFTPTSTGTTGTGGTGGTTGGGGGGAGSSVPLPPAAYAMPFGALMAWFAARRLRGRAVNP